MLLTIIYKDQHTDLRCCYCIMIFYLLQLTVHLFELSPSALPACLNGGCLAAFGVYLLEQQQSSLLMFHPSNAFDFWCLMSVNRIKGLLAWRQTFSPA